MVPPDLRYTKDHEWVRLDGDVATVGVTDFAAEQLGDVVFVELPDAGRSLSQHGTFGVVESVKAVSDPFGGGWMIRLRVADSSEVDGLLDATAYEQLTSNS